MLESHLQPRLQSLHARRVHAPFWAAMPFEGPQLVPREMVLATVPRQSERHQGRLNWERVSLVAKTVHRVRRARTNAERVPVAEGTPEAVAEGTPEAVAEAEGAFTARGSRFIDGDSSRQQRPVQQRSPPEAGSPPDGLMMMMMVPRRRQVRATDLRPPVPRQKELRRPTI